MGKQGGRKSSRAPRWGACECIWLSRMEARPPLLNLAIIMYPIRTMSSLVALLMGMVKFPLGTPKRAGNVTAHLNDIESGLEPRHESFSEPQVAELVDRVGASSSMTWLLSRVRRFVPVTDGTMHLVPQVEACVVPGCGGRLSVHTNTTPRNPKVYSDHGKCKGILYLKSCEACHARHYMSMAEGGTILADKVQLPFKDAITGDCPWFQSSASTIYAKALMRRFDVQALHSHTGWMTFCQEYRDLHGETSGTVDSDRKLFSHAWLVWALLCWREELGIATEPLGLDS